ncbi:MSMEG_4193 family putative phosphomutase [Demetria terragena]|uniref:MSMEG_4193 family putative phosphomutase n=1 Tax=Demetria terragena TaxID=63959 RepID=UPI00036E9780|nr:MSMEG_4193 family putative phosphomutase [Demetria terragena]
MPTVLLIRHGRTTANSSGVLAGWSPGVGLDETGVEHAARLGQRLRTVALARLVSSPLQRCQETAAHLAQDRANEVETDDDLGECRYGGWTGKSLSDLAKEPLWRVVQDHPSGATFPPDATYAHESLAQMQARAVAAIRRLDREVAEAHGEHAVWAAVSHGDVIKALLADAFGMHLDSFQRIVVNPASLSVVRYAPRRAFVLRSNDTGGVDDLLPSELQSDSSDATPGGSPGADHATASDD